MSFPLRKYEGDIKATTLRVTKSKERESKRRQGAWDYHFQQGGETRPGEKVYLSAEEKAISSVFFLSFSFIATIQPAREKKKVKWLGKKDPESGTKKRLRTRETPFTNRRLGKEEEEEGRAKPIPLSLIFPVYFFLFYFFSSL